MHVISGLALAGLACGLAACSADRQYEADRARANCRQTYPEVKGSFVALSGCLDRADDLTLAQNDADIDIVTDFQQSRRGLANSADAGVITRQDYDTRLTSVQSGLDRELQRRNAAQLHQAWGISHGLDENTRPDMNPVPVLPMQ